MDRDNIPSNGKKPNSRTETMLDLHARIAQNSTYGFGSVKRFAVFEDYQAMIDRIQGHMIHEAQHYLLNRFPKLNEDKNLWKAVVFGISAHIHRNLLYNGKPYFVHLEMVYEYAMKYKHLLKKHGIDPLTVLMAIWLHDVIEDCSLTFNDIKKHFGEDVAELAFLLSNNRGRTREERADKDYYQGIGGNIGALFIKICDRLANVEYGKTNGGDMFEKYGREQEHFRSTLEIYSEQGVDFSIMFDHIEEMLGI